SREVDVSSMAESKLYTSDVQAYIGEVGRQAREASRALAAAPTAVKSAALTGIARALDASRPRLLEANRRDLAAARERGLEQPLVDRLALDERAIDRMIEGLEQVDKLPDPVGEISGLVYR